MPAYLVGQHAIGSFASPVNNTTADADVVRGNDNTIGTQHNAHDSDTKLHLQQGPFANRPAFGLAGQTYLATDTNRLYVDTGAAWSELAYLPAVGSTVTTGVDGDGIVVSGNVNNVGIHVKSLAAGGVEYSLQSTGGASGYGQGKLMVVSGSGAGSTQHAAFDASATAGDTRFLLWDVTAGALVRVTRGALDSGGAGFRLLRVPN